MKGDFSLPVAFFFTKMAAQWKTMEPFTCLLLLLTSLIDILTIMDVYWHGNLSLSLKFQAQRVFPTKIICENVVKTCMSMCVIWSSPFVFAVQWRSYETLADKTEKVTAR